MSVTEGEIFMPSLAGFEALALRHNPYSRLVQGQGKDKAQMGQTKKVGWGRKSTNF